MSSTPDQPGPPRQPAGGPSVTAVVLAWQAEPWLPRCVEALLASEKVSVEVVLVDNGCTTDDVEILARRPGVTVVRPSRNLGFSGGCNAGAAAATGEFLALVNSDAVVEPGTLARLVEEVSRPGVGIAVASIRLADDPALLNAGANPIHVLGLSWSGGMGEREERTEPVDTAGASGACLLTTLAHWQRLGGFDEEYFAYHEDAELSVRTWRLGLRVVYVPDAVAVHPPAVRPRAPRRPARRAAGAGSGMDAGAHPAHGHRGGTAAGDRDAGQRGHVRVLAPGVA